MNILLNLSLISIFFPWVSFGILQLDTQPWFIILSSAFVFVNIERKLCKPVCFSLLLFISSVSVGVAYGNFDFLFFRAILSYYSFFIVLCSYYIMRAYYIFPIKVLIVSNFIWLFSGLLQVVLDKHVLSFLVHVRTTDDRGVTGLAPEPTFYGIFLFFMSWLLYLERDGIQKSIFNLLIILNVVFIVFVAKSSMVILFLMISIFLYFVFNIFSVKRILLVSVFLFLSVLFVLNLGYLFEGSRVYKLVMLLQDNPLYIISRDASINERASHVYFSISYFFSDFGYPHGFHAFSQVIDYGRSQSNGLFWWGGVDNKIMSGLGGVLFELGWFSLIFIGTVAWFIYSRNNIKYSIYSIFLFLGIFVSAIPISFSLLPVILVSSHFYFMKK